MTMPARNDIPVATDNEGYLLDPEQWSETLALEIAASENITMTDAHWEIVNFAREHFELYQSVPENRTLLKTLRERHGREVATGSTSIPCFPTASASRPARSPACASR